MRRINGIITYNINFYLDLDDPMFDECETVADVLKVIKNNAQPFEEISDKREVQKILYEGFELEVDDLNEW